METVKQLRERSQLVLLPSDAEDAPLTDRSIDQMEREMREMRESIKADEELQAKAHYSLASEGIDAQFLSAPLKTSMSFEKTESDNHTDVKHSLKEEREGIPINTVKDQTQTNMDVSEDFFEHNSGKPSTSIEQEKSDELDLKEFEKYNNATGLARISDYANVVAQLNQSRMMDADFDLTRLFAHINNMSELKWAQEKASEAWEFLEYLVKNTGIDGRLEGRFLKQFINEPYNSKNATATRRQLINTAKSWLEKQTVQYINSKLDENATKIKIGGIPSFTHRLKAYINFTFKTTTGWTDDQLEIIEDMPIWIFIYLLMRTGHLDLAARFVRDQSELFAKDSRFVSYFEEYITSADHSVSKATRQAILADYQRFVYSERHTDPYKIIIYKIIGRCELDKKSLSGVIRTSEDYLWLQFTLIRETTEPALYEYENYRLADVQADILSRGSTFFHDEKPHPWIYFNVLLVTLQFEKAIEFLYSQEHVRLETVHFALAFYYYGLVRVRSTEASAIVSKDESDGRLFYLNMKHLIYQYAQVFLLNDPTKALQYLCLLTLYSPKQGYANTDMIHAAQSCVCKYTMTKGDFKTLLGTFENDREPGLIEPYSKLLDIHSEHEYIHHILNPIAEQCTAAGRRKDAIYIYSLSRDYNKTIDVLIKEIFDALQRSQSYKNNDVALPDTNNTEITQFSLHVLEQYERHEQFSDLVTPERKQTILILVKLLQFRELYVTQQYEQALQLLEYLNIIPFNEGFSQLQNSVSYFYKQDETVKKNIPEILMNTVDILFQTWKKLTENSSVYNNEVEALERKVDVILSFVALIQEYIPNNMIIELHKVEMFMSMRK